jgi:SNF2 family DNA or RNA helicase
MSTCCKVQFPASLKTQEEKDDWLDANLHEFRGVFHEVHWERIVLDEAHEIKNHRSQRSIAIRELKAKFKWAITGTPIHNDPRELYSYFQFCQVDSTGNFRTFMHNYNPKKVGVDRLHTMLNKIMLRRVHTDELLGQPCLRLPKSTQHAHWVQFNAIERKIYNIVEKRFIDIINEITGAGKKKLEGSYNCIFTLLLRLRQMTSHILLVETAMQDLLTEEDLADIEKVTQHYSNPNLDATRKDTILRLQTMLDSCKKVRESSVPRDRLSGGTHGVVYEFEAYLKKLKNLKKLETVQTVLKCSLCSANRPKDAVLTSCAHLYCNDCIKSLAITAASVGESSGSCAVCFTQWTDTVPYTFPGEEEAESSTTRSNSPSDARRNKNKKKKKSIKAGNSWIFGTTANGTTDRDQDDETPILPSAKSIVVKAQILNWMQENAHFKCIIFSQFLPMLHVLKRMCTEEGWECIEVRFSV